MNEVGTSNIQGKQQNAGNTSNTMEPQLIITPEIFVNAWTTKTSIGAGGFGSVFKINIDGKPFAVKVISKQYSEIGANQTQNLEELQREGIPHVYKYITHFSDLNNNYLVLEYLEGLDLSKIIRNRIKIKNIESFCTDLIENVKAFHEKDFFHNDIKLENIMVKLDGDGNVQDFKFIDFGLSFFWREGTPMKKLRKKLSQGTLGYFSPSLLDFKRNFTLSTPFDNIKEEFVKKDLFSIFLVCTYLKSNLSKLIDLENMKHRYDFFNYVCALKANTINNFKSISGEMFTISEANSNIAEILKETMDDKKYGSNSIYEDYNSLSGKIQNIQEKMKELQIAFQKTQSKQQNPKPEGG